MRVHASLYTENTLSASPAFHFCPFNLLDIHRYERTLNPFALCLQNSTTACLADAIYHNGNPNGCSALRAPRRLIS